MDEIQKTEIQSENTIENSDGGNQQSTENAIDRANALLKRLEETEARLDEKQKKLNIEIAKDILAGRSRLIPEESPEEKLKKESDRIVNQYFR